MRYRFGLVPKARKSPIVLLIFLFVTYLILASSLFSPRAECHRAARALGYEYAHPIQGNSCVILFEDHSWRAISF